MKGGLLAISERASGQVIRGAPLSGPTFRSCPAIYVIETNQYATGIGEFRKPKSGRTTSQNSFVRIDRLLTLARTSHEIVFTMTGPPGARVIAKVE